MTDEQLKSALVEVRDYMLRQFPAEDADYEFSTRFRKKMKQLIEMEKHPIMFYVKRVAAAVLIVVGITGGMLFGFSKEVRADVVRWFMDHFAENGYRYRVETEVKVDFSQYTMEGIVPEGYQLVKRDEGEFVLKEAYRGVDGDMLVFVVMSSTHEEELNLSFNESTKNEVAYVGSNQAELYVSEEPDEASTIIWRGSNGALFVIMGNMDKEQLIRMAEETD
ncbi:MAG: DUF4367 domain-containing protein [Lachnospiraceae bacterium]|jgi:hypothetical protein|nr:DUF4367 domain-containing protein [Lachnospiraceae bacterium]